MTPPCPRRSSLTPHWKVNRGQPFNIGWSSGHGGPVYIALINAEDEDKLRRHSQYDNYILRRYLAEAPPSAKTRYQDEFWDKYHLGYSGPRGGSASIQLYEGWGSERMAGRLGR